MSLGTSWNICILYLGSSARATFSC